MLADRRQIVSALYNLLDNATKYSDEGSMVEVATRSGEGMVDLVVADTGIGIPARDVERVFERFYRVDHARSRQTGGTGLGLAIVRHVAVNHGGEVLVESRLGEGSTFTLRLPAAPEAVVAPADPQSGEDLSNGDLSNGHVAVDEDTLAAVGEARPPGDGLAAGHGVSAGDEARSVR